MLYEAVALGAVAIAANVVMDPGAQGAPYLERSLETVLLDARGRPVDPDPGHQLRVSEVPPLPAHLPNAAIGLAPFLGDEPHQHRLHPPRLGIRLDIVFTGNVQGIHQLA